MREDPEARGVLASLMQLEREVVELRYTQRLDATERVREALRRLADAGVAPLETLDLAAAELGGCTSFDRVLVSLVLRDGIIEPAVSWRADGAPASPLLLVGELGAAPPGRTSIEARVAASGRTVLVDPSRDGVPSTPRSAWAIGGHPFVLGTCGQGARGGGGARTRRHRPGRGASAGELDRSLLELFAAGLASVLERAALEHALARHRMRLAAAARFLERRIDVAAAPVAPPAPVAAAADVGVDPLTDRELEVLSLVAQGHTNRGAAQLLGISEGTVKYHVKNILRKLRARSRADAVARHMGAAASREPSR